MDQEYLDQQRPLARTAFLSTQINLPARCGEDVMTWKSMIVLSMCSTFVVWPRRIVRKYEDGFGGGEPAAALAVACCWSACGGIPPEKMMNGSPLGISSEAFLSKWRSFCNTYEVFTELQMTLETGPRRCVSSLAMRATPREVGWVCELKISCSRLQCGYLVLTGLSVARRFHTDNEPSQCEHMNCRPSWCHESEVRPCCNV